MLPTAGRRAGQRLRRGMLLLAALLATGAVVVLLPAWARRDTVFYHVGAVLGAGVFEEPIGISYSGGRLHVSDAARNRIVVFDTSGVQLDEWDGGETPFERPMHLTRGPDGLLYLAEYQADRISVLDSLGQRVRTLGGVSGPEPGAFDAPGGAVRLGGSVLVADFYNHRVQSLGADGSVLILGQPGRVLPGRLNYPTAVAVGDSLVYVADAYNNRVQVFEPGGAPVRRWGGPFGFGLGGRLKGWFRVATGLHVYRDTVYVADFYNDRIQIFSSGGKYLGRVTDSLSLPTAVARGGRGELYVVDHGHRRVIRFDP